MAQKYKVKTPSSPSHKIEISADLDHIWDHLNMRYDQLQLTMIYSQFVHDIEFKKILDRGQSKLKKQASILEKKSTKYEIPVPEQPLVVNEAPIDPEIIEDKFAYRRIFKGLQEAVDLHVRAVVETIRNDSVRNMFFNFLQEELVMKIKE